jgi:hypothetical protein
VIVDSGDHWHEFRGGAKTGGSQDSFMYVEFKQPTSHLNRERIVDVKPEVEPVAEPEPEVPGFASQYLQGRKRMISTKSLHVITLRK